MKSVVVLTIVASLANIVAANGACPGRAGGTSTTTPATFGTTAGGTGSATNAFLASPALRQAYLQQLAYQQYQQQARQQQIALAEFKQQERDRKIALRKERLAAQAAQREVTKARNLYRRSQLDTKIAASP